MTATKYETWKAGMTRRWHANADMSDANDTVDAHSARMARMALDLFCDWPLSRVCLYHDLAESIVGDVPHPAKEMLPAFRTVEAAVGADMEWDRYLEPDEPDQASRLRLLDRLDAYLMMLHHKPRLRKRDDWRKALSILISMADDCGVVSEVGGMIRDARR